MCDVVSALKSNESALNTTASSAGTSDLEAMDTEVDWLDDVNDDDDSASEDSDDDSLNSRLCTFTQTQKEFMNQHWQVLISFLTRTLDAKSRRMISYFKV